MNGSVRLRVVLPEDAAALREIYAPYVEQTAITFEYHVPSTEEFRERICRTRARYPYLAAESGGELLGYAYAGVFHAREAYRWTVETSLYVREDVRRQGIGRLLHTGLEQTLSVQKVVNLNACISYPGGDRPDDPPAPDPYLDLNSVEFHRHLGYRMVGRFCRCGYKFHRWYDIVWMERHIGPHPPEMPSFRPFPEAEGEIRALLERMERP